MNPAAIAPSDAQKPAHVPRASTLDSSSAHDAATLLGALSDADEASVRAATKPYVQELAEFRAHRSWRIMSALNARSRCRVWTGGPGSGTTGGYGATAYVPPDELPTVPVAVHAYDRRDRAPRLLLDFDAKHVPATQVKADVALLVRILSHIGLDWISAVNLTGGRHVYVALDRPRPRSAIRALIPVLASGLPSLDRTTMMSSRSAIRVPGVISRCGGGYQQAMQSDDELRRFVQSRSDESACNRLFGLRWIGELGLGDSFVVPVVKSPRPARARCVSGLRRLHGPPARIRDMALTGERDTQRYPSGSEARMAIVSAYRWAGYSPEDVERLIATELCGYRALCAHRREPWRTLLARDLATAADVDELADPRRRSPGQGAHVVAAGRWLAETRALLPGSGERRFDLGLLVEALARIAAHAGLSEIEASYRYIGVAAGLGWQRVRELMPDLGELGALTLLPRAHVTAASRWTLRPPEADAPGDTIPQFEAHWAPAALGPRARAVWTGLAEAQTATGLARMIGVERRTVATDLTLLAHHGLVSRTGRTRNTRWTRTEETPEAAARAAGLTAAVDDAAARMLAESRTFAASGIGPRSRVRPTGDDPDQFGGPAADAATTEYRSEELTEPGQFPITANRGIRTGRSDHATLDAMTTSRTSRISIPSAQCDAETPTARLANEDSRETLSVSEKKSALHRIPIPDLADDKLFGAYIAAVDDEELRRLPRRRPRRSDLIVAEMTQRGIDLGAARKAHLAARGI